MKTHSGSALSLSDEITSVYRGWYRWTEAHEGEIPAKFIIVDDLNPSLVSPRMYESAEQILSDLDRLRNRLEKENKPFAALSSYTSDKLAQSQAYLRQMLAPARVSREAIESRGTPFENFDEVELVELSREIQEMTEATAAERGPDLLAEVSPMQVPSEIQETGLLHLEALHSLFEAKSRFGFGTRSVDSPLPWRNIVTYSSGRFELLVNVSERYTKGVTEIMGLHEICGHMFHLNLLKESVQASGAPHLLCLAIHTQDAFLAEGIAQLLTELLLARGLLKDRRIAVEIRKFVLRFAVRQKNLCDLVEGRCGLVDATERHVQYLGGTPQSALSLYSSLLGNSFFCSQVMNYYSSYRALVPLLQLWDEPMQIEKTRELLNSFYGPSELRGLIRGALENQA